MTYRLGFHVPLFKNRLFIEPSVAVTNWPVNTNVPESFQVLEGEWPGYSPFLYFMPSFSILFRRVLGLIPRISAAPPSP